MLAKELGLGRKPKARPSPVAAPTAATPKPIEAVQEPDAKPMRRRRPRSASNTAGVANETVGEPTPAAFSRCLATASGKVGFHGHWAQRRKSRESFIR